MELWIRSQNGQKLFKINGLSVYMVKHGDGFWVIDKSGEYSFIDDNYLGIYKTKERALEVLDEIQEFINEMTFSKIVGAIYKMPEE